MVEAIQMLSHGENSKHYPHKLFIIWSKITEVHIVAVVSIRWTGLLDSLKSFPNLFPNLFPD